MAPTDRSRSSLAGSMSPRADSPTLKFQRRGSADASANARCKLFESTIASRGKRATYVRLQRSQQRRPVLEECWSEATTISPPTSFSPQTNANAAAMWSAPKAAYNRPERSHSTSPVERKTPVPHMMNNPVPLTPASVPPLLPALVPPIKSTKSRSPSDRPVPTQPLAGSCPNFTVEEDECSNISGSSTSAASARSLPTQQNVRGSGGLSASANGANLKYMYGGSLLDRTQASPINNGLIGCGLRASENPSATAMASSRPALAAALSPRSTSGSMSLAANPYERSSMSQPAPAPSHSSFSVPRAQVQTPAPVAVAPPVPNHTSNFSDLQAVLASRPAMAYSKQIMYAGRRRLLHSCMLQLRSRLRVSLPAISEERWAAAPSVLLVSV